MIDRSLLLDGSLERRASPLTVTWFASRTVRFA